MHLRIGKKKSTHGIRSRVTPAPHGIPTDMKEVFIGHRTVVSVILFVVGGILVGRSLYQYLSVNLGLPLTILIGIVVFALSGAFMHQFDE